MLFFCLSLLTAGVVQFMEVRGAVFLVENGVVGRSIAV